MNNKWLNALAVVMFLLIIFLPPVIHRYSYPTMGDDTAEHLRLVDNLKIGKGQPLYFAQALAGYSLIWGESILRVKADTLFLWFNFSVLAVIGLTLAMLLSKTIPFWMALIASLLIIFGVGATFKLFIDGTIFNLVNVLLFLVVGLYGLAQFVAKHKLSYLAIAIVGLGMFLVYHPSGLLPTIINTGIKLPLPSSIIAPPIIPVTQAELIGVETIIPFWWWLVDFVGVGMLAILGLAIFILYQEKAKVELWVKIFVGLLFVISLGHLVLAYSGWSNYATRLQLNAGLLIGVIIVTLFAIALGSVKRQDVRVLLLFIVLVAVMPNLITWFGYNSAVRKPDQQAINYVNQLSIKNVAVSNQIAPWIYFRYLNKPYDSNSDIEIYRTMPMTLRSYLLTARETQPLPDSYLFKADDGVVAVYVVKRGAGD